MNQHLEWSRKLPGDVADAARSQRVGGDATDRHLNRNADLARLMKRSAEFLLQRHDPASLRELHRYPADAAAPPTLTSKL